MSSIELSLDEIIAKNRVNKTARGKNITSKSFTSFGAPRRAGDANKRRSMKGSRNGEDFTKKVPTGTWKRDKFDSADSTPSVLLKASANKKVRVNLSGLAASVTTGDLEELFTPYHIDSAVVHYGADREPLGTGEVVLEKKDAERALNDFKGVAIDGSRVVLAIVDGGSIFDRVQMVKKVGGGVEKRTQSRPFERSGERQNRDRHPLDRTEGKEIGKTSRGKVGRKEKKPTEEELDAQLEEYMKK